MLVRYLSLATLSIVKLVMAGPIVDDRSEQSSPLLHAFIPLETAGPTIDSIDVQSSPVAHVPRQATSTKVTVQTKEPGKVDPQYVLTGFEGCSPSQKTWIQDGFYDMITMINAEPDSTYRTFDWDSAPSFDYWGPVEKTTNAMRSRISENLDRAASVTYQWWTNPFASRLHARCDDPKLRCTCIPGKGSVNAYTINHEPHINFCPPYFNMRPLADAMAAPDGDAKSITGYYSRAKTWSHELMHVRDIGAPWFSARKGIVDMPVLGWPGVPYDGNDPSKNVGSYGSLFTKWLAQAPGSFPGDVVDNADNYALFFLSMYIFSQKGFYPSDRQCPITPTSADGGIFSASSVGAQSPFEYNSYCFSASDSWPEQLVR